MNDFALTPPPGAWPLLFKFRAPVLGNGFLALVQLHGRLLARQDGDRLWLEGVNPGALALDAPSIETASLELHSTLIAVLTDLAEQSDSFNSFQTIVEQFFWDTDSDTEAEWKASVAAVQAGYIAGPSTLPVCPATSPLFVEVTFKSLETVTPKDNATSQPVLAAVA